MLSFGKNQLKKTKVFFLFFRIDYDGLVGTCYAASFGPGPLAWNKDSDRKKRSFDKKVEEAGRKLSTVDEVVDFFVSKDAYWNNKLVEELVLTRLESSRQFIKLQRELEDLLVKHANSSEIKFRDFFTSDIKLFWETYWTGDNSSEIGTMNFGSWIWKQWPMAWISACVGSVIGVFFKFTDDSWAASFVKNRKVQLNGVQKVISLHSCLFRFLLKTFSKLFDYTCYEKF